MIKVVPKLLLLLKLFSDGREYSFSEVTEKTGLSRSNASHLLDSLVKEKLLIRSARGVYRRGEEMLLLGGRDPFAEFRRITRNGALLLREQLDELSVVAVRRGIFRTTVEKLQPARLLQVSEKQRAGYPADWYGTGNGRLLLAYAPREDLLGIIRHCGLPPKEIWKEAASLPRLEKELSTIREQGFASLTLNNEVRAIAVPVADSSGENTIALSTAFPLFRRPRQDEIILDKLHYVASCMQKEFQSAGIKITDIEKTLP